ncbi:hypothetical protein ACFL3H_05540 [Gemmatimonadota bacterium]
MRCILCDEPIEHYQADFHSLRIDEHRTVDICDECTRKFVTWHGERLADLFPTSAMKKWHGKHDSR